jgi:PPM family protein phosphatase
VALGIVEQVGRTDVGRQRSANEDALVLRPPFFAVADGMGGARAGEVASAIAAEAFEGVGAADEGAEAQLTRLLREANRRIYKLAVTDESHRGMGTTLTAAKVHGGDVSVGHVGDSRAYRMRDGELEQITRDHSLVAELERSGQITPEAAEHHPQRSIITRALGPEPDVDVDTYTLSARDGDLFLLCSDGLTSMISDDEVAAILRIADSLEDAAKALIQAANQSGGRDNITVVMFRLGEAGADAEEPTTVAGPARADDETIAGQLSTDDVRTAATPPPPTPARGPIEPVPPAPAAPRAEPKRRRRVGLVLKCLLGLAVLAAAVTGLYALSRQVYFVGTNDGGLVTVYRGIPYELPLGIDLYEEEYTSGMPARAIPSGRRARVLDHEWRSREDAVDLVRAPERGQLEAAGGSGG